MLQKIHVSHMPPDLALYVALYHNVQNAAYLRGQLLAGNADFEYAFVDASMIVSSKHLLAAAFRAMNDYLHERLKSRNVHSEIVFALSPNNNIGEAFRRFGINDATSDLLVLKVATSTTVLFDGVNNHLRNSVQGTPTEFNDENLQVISNLSKISKAYKVNLVVSTIGEGKKSRKEVNEVPGINHEPDERRRIEVAVLGAIALRGAT